MDILSPSSNMASDLSKADSLEVRTGLFRQITGQYAAGLRRTCRGYERDEARQDELMQEIWLALWTSLPTFEGRSSLKTWVYRVAHNKAVSHVSREVRIPETTPVEIDTLAQHLQDPETQLDRQRARKILAELIRRLPPVDRQLILMHLEGFSGKEIAEVIGLSPSNVTTRLSRIRNTLGRRENP